MLSLTKAQETAASAPPTQQKAFDKTPIPAGTYNLIVKDAEWNEAYLAGAYGRDRKERAVEMLAADPSLRPGKALHCCFEVADGQYAGRLIWDDFVQECASDCKEDRRTHKEQEADGARKVLGLAFYARVTNDELQAGGVGVFANKLITVEVTQWQAKRNFIQWALPKDGSEAPKPVVTTARPVADDSEPPF